MKLARVAVLVVLAGFTACREPEDLESGRSYACDPSQPDRDGAPQCAEGWRCSSEGFCVEPPVGGRRSCARDEECLPGFICGADSLCRDRDVNADYVCRDDLDCVPSWTCGVARRCVDPALDVHDPAAPFHLLDAAERLSPSQPTAPDLYSMNMPFVDPPREFHYYVAKSEGARFSSYSARGPADAGQPFTIVSATTQLAEPPKDLVANTNGLGFALTSSGLQAHGEGGQPVLVEPRLAGMERLDLVPGALLSAWSPTSVAVGTVSGDSVQLLPLASGGEAVVASPGDGGSLLEVAAFTDLTGQHSVVAVAEQGLYMRTLDGGAPWQPVATGVLAHDECVTDGGTLLPTDVISGRNNWLTLIARPLDGGTERFGLTLDGTLAFGPQPACAPQLYGRTLRHARGPCSLCPPGGRLVTARPSSSAFGLYVRCEVPAGSGVEESYETGHLDSCVFTRVAEQSGAAPVLPARGIREVRAHATANGRLYGPGAPVLMDRIPATLVRVGDALVASVPRTAFGAQSVPLEYAHVPAFGMARTELWRASHPVPAGRSVTSTWVVDAPARAVRLREGTEPGGLGAIVAQLAPNGTEGMRAPLSVDAAAMPDGGTLLVVASYDLLFAARLSSPEPATPNEVPLLVGRSAPSPSVPIRQMLLVPPATDAIAEGYALTDNALFFFRALSEQRWEHGPIDAPKGDTVALWRHDGRVRLGYADGRVFALPGRLELAPSVEGESFFDFAFLCGRTYAATSKGLRRLEPSPDGPGQWTAEPRFAAATPGMDPNENVGARLFVGPRELFWAGSGGTLVRFTAPAECAP